MLPASKRALPAVRIDSSGRINSISITKKNLANDLSLPLRDLRIVDPSFPKQIQATFKARPRAIVFSIENIKVVVKVNEAIIFNPSQPEVQDFVPALQQQIAQRERNGDSDGPSMHLRFEHQVIDAALQVVCNGLQKKVQVLAPAVEAALRGLRAPGLDVVQTQADELLPLKNDLYELQNRVKELKNAVSDVYETDEDMAMMYLEESAVESNSACGLTPDMNLEMMLENYLNEAEWIASEVQDIIDEIKNTEENVVLQLDIIRNRLLRFELVLSVSSFVVSCGALITGLFGMNLLSHLEMAPGIFWLVSMLISGGMLAIGKACFKYGRKERLL